MCEMFTASANRIGGRLSTGVSRWLGACGSPGPAPSTRQCTAPALLHHEEPEHRHEQKASGPWLGHGTDLPEESVQLVADARSKVQILILAEAEHEAPKVGDYERIAVRIAHRAQELAGQR